MAMPSKPGEYAWAREGEILRCPWHGWEFDITTGRSVFNPHTTRVRSYEVTVEPAAGFDEDERVETYPVSVEDGFVVLHV
jgi:nitrite reductase/ring-hydroxylating ferredoxin subunit